MYAWTVLPVVSLTFATLRLAELGFFGFAMKIWLTTPFFCVFPSSSGDLDALIFLGALRRVAWFKVAEAGRDGWNARDRGKAGRARLGAAAR